VKISCPSCSAKYSISDEKVVSRLAKIRCRKCGATIVIDGKVNPPQVTTSAGGDAADAPEPAESASAEYSIDFGEGDQRTLPVGEIVAAYNAGQITGETYVWADGFADWKPLSEVQDIVDALHSAAGSSPGSKPQAASAPMAAPAPWEAKASQPIAERAAARPGRTGASDLFGRADRAGSEEEVATSAPEPAPGIGGGGNSTGSRNESSVLFSLSALTSAAKPSGTGSRSSGINLASAGNASREDSGLIDLKALTAAAVKQEPSGSGGLSAPAVAPLAAAPLGVAAPLGLGSPIGGSLAGAELGAPQKSKTGLFIAIGIVVAAVIVALAVILKPQPPPIVVAPPPPAATPAPAPTPTPTPTLAATPPPTGSAASEDAPKDDKKKSTTTAPVHRSGGATKKSSGSSSPAPAGGGDTPAPAPKPKSNSCGCAPTDLVCNMRCRAKG
jgi:predicted Zn finger-like uncharacterized protein